MPYSQIVTLNSMRSAYNIKKEGPDDWKSFITNDQFNDILTRTIKAVRNNDADTHRSMWIAGTYGTGKSHAGAVIQHLLCDPIENITDYVEDEYKKPKYAMLKNAILQVREEKRLFPVNMYGQHSIAHEDDLSLQLQREIKAALKKANINITVKTDFDMYVQHIENQPAIWENLIEQNALLASVAPDTNKLRQRLVACDTEVLDCVRQALRKGGIEIRLQSNNLEQWIFEVQEELRELTDYDGLLIVWDEFTEIMTSTIGVRLLVRLQEIAESMMSPENDSYFLFISHPSALNTLKEDEREKTKGRYHYVHYNMEPVSAFKIMSKKFRVVDDALYEKRKARFFNLHSDLLDQFSTTGTNAEETKENIKNLFPLHPGTANLATYFAREAGSSSRSVFDFLASDPIKVFLDDEDAYDNELTITADFLWDYVKEYFESDSTKFGAVTERYNSHHLQVEAAGPEYLKVFKGILLLNALNNIANSDTVTPSTENISLLFSGTEMMDNLEEVLNFFNDKSIIQRQPNGNFSILFTALPGDEIQKIKEKLKATNYLYTDSVIKFGETARKAFDNYLKSVARPLNYQFFSVVNNESTLLNRIENAKKMAQPYEIFLAIMVARTNEELITLKDIAERNCQEERFENIVFVVVETVMGMKNFERFIEYQANAECAQGHNLPQQHQTYTNQASELIGEWVKNMRGSNVSFYLQGDSMLIVGSKMATSINNSIAPEIFNKGPEALEIIRTRFVSTYWKKASVKATVDAVLSYNTKADIIEKCGGPAKHVEFLLQDSVDENLEWKDDVSNEHPLKMVCSYVDEWLSGRHTPKNQSFNLGEKLIGLTQPPYGMFQTYSAMAMVAFAMRKYVNQIYDTNGKQRSAQHIVDDVVEMFKAWENGKSSNKLNFMFESKEANKVCKSLIRMFSLNKLKGYSDISSLKDARWAVTHEYAKEKGYPLWSLKYCDACTPELAELIDNIRKVVSDPESMKNPSLLEAMINSYDLQKMEFNNLLIPSSDNYRKGFEAFMKDVEFVNVANDEIDEAMEFLRGHLQGEVGLWTEFDVKDKLKNWRMAKQASAGGNSGGGASGGYPPVAGGYPIGGGTGTSGGSGQISEPGIDDRCNAIKKKIVSLDSQKLVDIISKLADVKNSYILNLLEQYVQ